MKRAERPSDPEAPSEAEWRRESRREAPKLVEVEGEEVEEEEEEVMVVVAVVEEEEEG